MLIGSVFEPSTDGKNIASPLINDFSLPIFATAKL